VRSNIFFLKWCGCRRSCGWLCAWIVIVGCLVCVMPVPLLPKSTPTSSHPYSHLYFSELWVMIVYLLNEIRNSVCKFSLSAFHSSHSSLRLLTCVSRFWFGISSSCMGAGVVVSCTFIDPLNTPTLFCELYFYTSGDTRCKEDAIYVFHLQQCSSRHTPGLSIGIYPSSIKKSSHAPFPPCPKPV
jgi:hypothetical protein